MTIVIGVVTLVAGLVSSRADPLVNSTIPLPAYSKIICAIYGSTPALREISDRVLLNIDLIVKNPALIRASSYLGTNRIELSSF
jgi:hypothetical protein